MEKKELLKILNHILDPDLRDRSIVEMGFVTEQDIKITEEEIEISYTVGGPLCPYSAVIGIIMHRILTDRFPQKIKVRMKKGHYQQEIVNEILSQESQFSEWWEKIKGQDLLAKCLRPFAPSA